MQFTIPVNIRPSDTPIDHSTPIVMLGSCFTDNIGTRLLTDGFDVSVNPMGALYNPATIARVVNRALERRNYTVTDLYEHSGVWHCLDYASRRQGRDPELILKELNDDFNAFSDTLNRASTWIVTFGTSWVFNHLPTKTLVGNCHKLPMNQFMRSRMSVDEIVQLWQPLMVPGRRIIFTVSPVRHLSDGLDGNTLSKATLRLAVDSLTSDINQGEYFPAFEIQLDELRDYRFYAADMKHPSEVAIDYIYSRFADTYFSRETRLKALDARHDYLLSQHRPIL